MACFQARYKGKEENIKILGIEMSKYVISHFQLVKYVIEKLFEWTEAHYISATYKRPYQG